MDWSKVFKFGVCIDLVSRYPKDLVSHTHSTMTSGPIQTVNPFSPDIYNILILCLHASLCMLNILPLGPIMPAGSIFAVQWKHWKKFRIVFFRTIASNETRFSYKWCMYVWGSVCVNFGRRKQGWIIKTEAYTVVDHTLGSLGKGRRRDRLCIGCEYLVTACSPSLLSYSYYLGLVLFSDSYLHLSSVLISLLLLQSHLHLPPGINSGLSSILCNIIYYSSMYTLLTRTTTLALGLVSRCLLAT